MTLLMNQNLHIIQMLLQPKNHHTQALFFLKECDHRFLVGSNKCIHSYHNSMTDKLYIHVHVFVKPTSGTLKPRVNVNITVVQKLIVGVK
jgi:hypothetical protein